MEPTVAKSNLQVLTEFAQNDKFLFIFTMVLLASIVFAILFIAFKGGAALFRRVKGVKIGDKELKLSSMDGPEGHTTDKTENYTKFASTISAIIQDAINTGYSNSVKRQELFNTQMAHIKENLDILQTAIIENYMTNGGENIEIAKAILQHTITKTIISKFRSICVADRLAEKTKDGVIEQNRNFIDNAYLDLWIELKNLVNYTLRDSKKGTDFVYQDDVLLESLKSQKDALKKIIVNSLEYAHEQAVDFLEEVQENNKQLDDKIQNLLNIHFEGNQNIEPQSWVTKASATPPNNVVGA